MTNTRKLMSVSVATLLLLSLTLGIVVYAQPPARSFTVDVTNPTAIITMNVTGDVKAGKVEFYAEFSEEMNGTVVPMIVSNSSSLVITGTDGWMTTANMTYGFNATISGSYNGTAHVNVTGATDLAGKAMVATNYTFYIDTVPPTAPGKLNATAPADSIVLEWLASADLGSGVERYDIIRDDKKVDSVDHPIVTFTDTKLTSSGTYFYKVVAYDEAGNSAPSNEANATYVTAEVTSYNVTLAKDWNIFSTPLIPDNNSIEAVLADVMENVTIVWSYTDGEWVSYIPGLPSGVNKLTDIEDGIGYWILMSAADTATVYGLELPGPGEFLPVYPVIDDWNLIGFKSVETMNISYYLTTIPLLVKQSSVCYGWDATIQEYEMVYIAANPVAGAKFEPGQGYWLYLTEDANIAPPEP